MLPAIELAPARLHPVGARSFELLLVEAGSGRPLAEVPLEVVTPDGQTRRLATGGAGRLRIEDLPPGTCLVSSAIDGALVDSSYAPAAAQGRPGG